MELDDRAFPLTQRQLGIWLAQETGRSAMEWQLGLFARVDGTVARNAFEQAIRIALREADPVGASFGVGGQVFQRAIECPDVEPAFYDLSGSHHPAQEAYGIASWIQRTVDRLRRAYSHGHLTLPDQVESASP